MSKKADLIRKLRSPDNKIVLQAVEELRVNGWLEDGSLENVPLCHVQMQGADLMSADLCSVDFHQAQLQNADLSNASLRGARFTRAKLQAANFSRADLKNADLFKADLTEARNLSSEQLATAKRLHGAIMPDELPYDGRYNLEGDLEFARWGRIDTKDPQAMADFYGVTLKIYLMGQRQLVNA
jgi:uncharacterized protein YjbI with pentapeptide repeats